jgi:hypothetical protein
MITNFFPLQFEFSNYQVVRVQAQPNLLKELRDKYNSTHSFFKHGDFIYISNKQGEDIGIGEPATMSLYENYEITASLIKHIYFRTFLEEYPDFKPNDFYPFVIQSQKDSNDLIRRFLPDGLKGRLCYLKQIEVQLRTCIINGKDTFGFLINVDRNWRIDVTCKELIDKKFDLIGIEVIHSVIIPGLQNILLPDESLVGIVKEIQNELAIVTTNEGDLSYKLDELYLRKTTRNIKAFLTFAFRNADKAESILANLENERFNAIKPKSVISDIKEASKILFFDKNRNPFSFENKDGFCFKVNFSADSQYKNFQLDAPIFVFDPARVRTNIGADFGLRSYGPYDSSLFTPKEPKILVICHQENRGKMAEFLKELIDGIPNSKYFTKGFKSKYELHNVSREVYEINSYEISQIQKITAGLKEKPDLAIIEIPARLKEISDVNASLYYQLKAHFLNLEIPIQIINSENIKKYDEYKVNAIGLQMYAKLGGVPWTIQTKESIDREIVIGIGNSIFRNNSFAGNEQERIVGISTFFSGDGQYMMSGNIKDVPYDEYFQVLLESLNESINTLAREYAWRDNDTVRLVFHIFKPIKNIEFDVVKQLVSKTTKYRIQFAFVTVSEFHPFKMFDETQNGIDKFGDKIGELVPNRGTNIVINETSCLVQMLGINEVKTSKHGASNPLLIKILRPSSNGIDEDIQSLMFFDLHYITQQIFKFSYLSWRGFMPNQKPATILYSGLIAKTLGKLRMMPGWKSEVINFNLRYKKWFL